MGNVNLRYGGMPVDDGLKYEADSYAVTQVKSCIGERPENRQTIMALGLGGIGKTNIVRATRSGLGMVRKVRHLVRVEPLGDRESPVVPAQDLPGTHHTPTHGAGGETLPGDQDQMRTDAPPNGASVGTLPRPHVRTEVGIPWDQQGEKESDQEKRSAVKLKDVIKDLQRLIWPDDLTEEQRDAAAALTADAVREAKDSPLDEKTSYELNRKVREIIRPGSPHSKTQ